jgi:hypothetical protein
VNGEIGSPASERLGVMSTDVLEVHDT